MRQRSLLFSSFILHQKKEERRKKKEERRKKKEERRKKKEERRKKKEERRKKNCGIKALTPPAFPGAGRNLIQSVLPLIRCRQIL
ncbi:hypothetical protein GAG34_06575 [Salmonella enterica]|uniref:hypothetical protein n=1 Tax=Salmonella enterica TaxID=28901 RepID=UPI000B99316C|nr:hypothetical protein [Salmonella enterica]ECQ4171650.1 hypothetical protein [Salmonella enterica]EDC3803020.1 hypothetical protein [Salmonella enterica]EDY8388950.1 hypothetical protein [Salmonella enterica]EDZ6267307.1 hypothetical protein [Salmonella enterica]EEJ7954922.1 hypothetical protein [Salmonella enterica]